MKKPTSLCLMFVIFGLVASKAWHESLPIFLMQSANKNQEYNIKNLELQMQKHDMYQHRRLLHPSSSIYASALRSILSEQSKTEQSKLGNIIEQSKSIMTIQWKKISNNIITYNACGATIGAFIAGMLTNAFGAPTMLPLSITIIYSISIIIMHLMSHFMPIYIILIYILAALRGVAIAASMNAAYAYVGLLYKNNKLGLTIATSRLYICLFTILGLVPLYAISSKNFYINLAGICAVISVVLSIIRRHFHESNTQQFNFVVEVKKYCMSFPVLLSNPTFIALCLTSMLCIGGFYNIIYIVKQMPQYVKYLPIIQQYARLSGALAIFIVINNRSLIANYIHILRIICTIFSVCGIGIVGYGIIYNQFIFLVSGFIMTAIFAASAQVFAKSDIISTAHDIEVAKDVQIIGSAQAMVTLANSAFESLGSILIFNIRFGHLYYLALCIMLYILILLNQFYNLRTSKI